MKKILFLLALALVCCFNLKAQSQKLTEVQTSLQMYTVDSMYYSIINNLGAFVESKDSSYYHRAKKVYMRLPGEVNFLRDNAQPAAAWSNIYITDMAVKLSGMDALSRFFFDDAKFFKEIVSDKDTSNHVVPMFIEKAFAKGAGQDMFNIRCSSNREWRHKQVVRLLDDAMTGLKYSMAILEKYVKDASK